MLNKIANQGLTLIEILIVVVIIGILSAIALPTYQNIVIKSRVSTILPLMRRWHDANNEWRLIRGYHCKVNGEGGVCVQYPNGKDLGVNWPKNWKRADVSTPNTPCGDANACYGDSWSCHSGLMVSCVYIISKPNEDDIFKIEMYSNSYPEEAMKGKRVCKALGSKADKLCKSMGSFYQQDEKYKIYFF